MILGLNWKIGSLNKSKKIENRLIIWKIHWFEYYKTKHPNLTEKEEKKAKNKRQFQPHMNNYMYFNI